jgi:hypothetical protein
VAGQQDIIESNKLKIFGMNKTSERKKKQVCPRENEF